jgi:hypothetical protein
MTLSKHSEPFFSSLLCAGQNRHRERVYAIGPYDNCWILVVSVGHALTE